MLSPQDRLAAQPLPGATPEQAQPAPLTTGSADAISLPPARSLGPAGVRTGFPHSPEGALAQLIAIDQRALESVSVVTAQDVIAGWAQLGGPTGSTWSGVGAVLALLSSAGLPAEQAADGTTGDLQVSLHPAMGLIKGSVGEDFVLACVDFVATITPPITAPASSSAGVRVAVADCQRMVWTLTGWRIGPGGEPAPAPSIWPGTKASYDAGYRWLTVTQ